MEKHGPTGYVVFFGIVEIYAREFKTDNDWKLTIKLSYLKQKLQIYHTKTLLGCLKSLNNLSPISSQSLPDLSPISSQSLVNLSPIHGQSSPNLGKWDIKISGDYATIFIPKFRKLLDESTLKKLRANEKSFRNDSGTLPKSDTTEVEVEVEVEVDVEEDKKKERKKERKKENILPDFIPKNLWQDFKEHRNKLKGTMTERAQKILIKKISDMSNGKTEIAQALIEQSIEMGWKGIFPLKDLQSSQIPKATTVYQADMLQKELVNQAYLKRRRQKENADGIDEKGIIDATDSPGAIN